MNIGVIVAMEKELMQLRGLLHGGREQSRAGRTFMEGTVGSHNVVLMQSGIGKVNAALGAAAMIAAYHPDLILSTGVAGGADVSLNVMDVVVATECRYHDAYCGSECEYGQIIGLPTAFTAPKEVVDKALSIDKATVRAGLTVSGDWFVDSREKMSDILSRFPDALAVDMESCAIAQACYIENVPFVSFRIISDIPLKDNKASQYFDFWQRLAHGSFEVTRQFLEKIK